MKLRGTPDPTPCDLPAFAQRGTLARLPVFTGSATVVMKGLLGTVRGRFGSYEDFARPVVPALRRRGLFHADYAGATPRETLGTATPPVGWAA